VDGTPVDVGVYTFPSDGIVMSERRSSMPIPNVGWSAGCGNARELGAGSASGDGVGSRVMLFS